METEHLETDGKSTEGQAEGKPFERVGSKPKRVLLFNFEGPSVPKGTEDLYNGGEKGKRSRPEVNTGV